MNFNRNIFIVVVIVSFVVIIFFIYKAKEVSPLSDRVEQSTATSTLSTEPQRTEFGTNMPTDFPADVPVEKEAKVEQSYNLKYVGQSQSTIVFFSTKTVKENYSLYGDQLKSQKWNIVNKYESTSISSLYATRENEEINITISGNISAPTIKSQVSISFLKK